MSTYSMFPFQRLAAPAYGRHAKPRPLFEFERPTACGCAVCAYQPRHRAEVEAS
jgi:hypothetical protein